MKLILILCLSFSLSFSSSAMAATGGWVMGGADQVGNKVNPWFMMAPLKVKYCIKVDTNFSASETEISRIVNLAIEYWRLDFIKLRKISKPTGVLEKYSFIDEPEIALQGYEKVSCDKNPEMRFLFGEGTLNQEEKTYISQFDFYAGSVRTDFDSKTLKSRGFIYVPSDVTWSWQPWKVSGLLYRVLVHEVGHVFGMQHSENGVMMADYPEKILNKDTWPLFKDISTLQSTLLPTVHKLKLSEGVVTNRTYGIRVVHEASYVPAGHYAITTLVDGVTLEWNTVELSDRGVKVPTVVRISPFLYEKYQLIDNKIVRVANVETQCGRGPCVGDTNEWLQKYL